MKWYRHFPSDFYYGTLGMSLEEIGAYIVVLGELYERDGVLADDDRRLSTLWRCDIRTARRLKTALLQRGKLQIEAGILVNARMRREALRANFRSELASISARKRWKNKDRHDAILDTRYKKERTSEERVAEKPTTTAKVVPISPELIGLISKRK